MFRIENDQIYLTRGDSAGFDVSIYNGTTPYTLQEGDILTFTVRQNLYSAKVIEKTGTTIHFDLEPADTKDLQFGDYLYDIQLTFANGEINTIIPPSLFQVMGEVTYGV